MLSTSQLKKLSALAARDLCQIGKISRFEMHLRDLIQGEISLPVYKPADLRRLRQELGISQSAMALLFDVQDKTVLRWERDGEHIPATICLLLCLLDRCRDSFFELFDAKRTRLTLTKPVTNAPKKAASENQDVTAETPDKSLGTPENPFAAAKLENRRSDMPETFDGAAIFHLRERLDLSRKDLADLLDVSESCIIKWETDWVAPKGPTLILLKSLWLHGFDALPE